MTWKHAYDYAGSGDAIDRLVALAERQPDVEDAGLDVLRRVAEALHVEVVVLPRKDSPTTLAEVEAVAEVLVDLCRRGLTDDDVAEEVQTICMIARDELNDLIYEYEECPWSDR